MIKSFTLILGLLAFASFGQQYFPLVDSKAKWVETREDVTGFRRYQHQMERDTTINDTNYKIFEYVSLIRCNSSIAQANSHSCEYPQYWDTTITISSIGFIREDTSSKTIYYKRTSNDSEIVLYNFNMKVQDTVFSDLLYDGPGAPMIVKKKDSVLVNNEYRNRFELSAVDPQSLYFTTTIIEGIGSTCGLLSSCAFFEGGTWLNCYKYDDEVLYSYDYRVDGDCPDIVSTSEKNEGSTLFEVQQNLSSLIINFTGDKDQKINLKIRTFDGKLQYSRKGISSDKWIVNFSEFNSTYKGIYILTIKNGEAKTNKLFQLM